jgi:hypothetical protein
MSRIARSGGVGRIGVRARGSVPLHQSSAASIGSSLIRTWWPVAVANKAVHQGLRLSKGVGNASGPGTLPPASCLTRNNELMPLMVLRPASARRGGVAPDSTSGAFVSW